MEVTHLETSGLLLTESLKVEESLENIQNHVGKIIFKLKLCFEQKFGIKIILKITEILDGNETLKDSLQAELIADECVHFKHAPITSVNVKQSFLAYKNILYDNRCRFLFKNFKKP